MTETELLTLIRGGENIRVEFKKSTNDVTKDVYDTVCSDLPNNFSSAVPPHFAGKNKTAAKQTGYFKNPPSILRQFALHFLPFI